MDGSNNNRAAPQGNSKDNILSSMSFGGSQHKKDSEVAKGSQFKKL
jgi:hypothetical protein